jgi:hypothetical protein
MKKFFLLAIIIATMLLGSGCKEKRLLPWLKIDGGFTLYVQGSEMKHYQESIYWENYYLVSDPVDSKFDMKLPFRPEELIYRDINKDGIKDIAVTHEYKNIQGTWREVSVAFGEKDGNFNNNFQELPPKLIKRNKIKIEKGNKKSLDYGS